MTRSQQTSQPSSQASNMHIARKQVHRVPNLKVVKNVCILKKYPGKGREMSRSGQVMVGGYCGSKEGSWTEVFRGGGAK